MSIKRVLSFIFVILIVAPVYGQNAPTIYAESFRNGTTQVTETKFEAKLTPDNATYRELIKDSYGKDRYELTVTPEGPGGDTQITAWRVKLRDLHHSIYNNILLEDQRPSQDAKNNLWWLTANPFAPVPVRARRIVKVDGFYVVMQVTNLHFTPLDSPYLDSMAVQFEFVNKDPRAK